MVCCGNRDNIVRSIGRWVLREIISIPASVPCGSDKQATGIDSIQQSLGKTTASPTVVGDADAIIVGIHNRVNCTRSRTATSGRKKFDPCNFGIPVNTNHTNIVITYPSNGACNMSTMTMIIHRVAIVIDKVITIDIVYITIAIIIYAIARNFAGISPHIVFQVFVGIIDAGINNTNNHIAITRSNIPGFGAINIRIWRTARLGDIVHIP